MRDLFGNKVEIGDLGYWVGGMGSPNFYLGRITKHQKRSEISILAGTYKGSKSWIETEKRFILISEDVTKRLLTEFAQ